MAEATLKALIPLHQTLLSVTQQRFADLALEQALSTWPETTAESSSWPHPSYQADRKTTQRQALKYDGHSPANRLNCSKACHNPACDYNEVVLALTEIGSRRTTAKPPVIIRLTTSLDDLDGRLNHIAE